MNSLALRYSVRKTPLLFKHVIISYKELLINRQEDNFALLFYLMTLSMLPIACA